MANDLLNGAPNSPRPAPDAGTAPTEPNVVNDAAGPAVVLAAPENYIFSAHKSQKHISNPNVALCYDTH